MTYAVWYKDGVQHLAHEGWSHTLCNDAVGYGRIDGMSHYAGRSLSEVIACKQCSDAAQFNLWRKIASEYNVTLMLRPDPIRCKLCNEDIFLNPRCLLSSNCNHVIGGDDE